MSEILVCEETGPNLTYQKRGYGKEPPATEGHGGLGVKPPAVKRIL